MCGIVGYIGKNPQNVLIEGLKKLEYRGYDSAGIAIKDEKEIEIYKSKGEIKNLEYIQAFDKLESMGLTVNLVKVKGHSNCEGNIFADKLATGEMTISQVMDKQ